MSSITASAVPLEEVAAGAVAAEGEGEVRVVLRARRIARFDADVDGAWAGACSARRVVALDLSMNRLPRLGTIVQCRHAEDVDVSRNLLSRVPRSLAGMPRLRRLSLANNGLDLGGMPHLGGAPELRELSLAYNEFKGVPALEGLPRLHTLRLEGNRLEALHGLGALPALRHLYVQRNRLRSLAGAALAPALETLHAARNELADADDLALALASLERLETLHLDGNPAAEEGRHRSLALEMPALRRLDGHEVKRHFRVRVREQAQTRDVDALIEGVTNEYVQRLADEKRRRDRMLARLDEQKRAVDEHYSTYKRSMEAELQELVRHLQEVRSRGGAARDSVTSPEAMRAWRARLAELERERKEEAEAAAAQEERRARGAGLSLDAKLYRIALARPRLWRLIKDRERELRGAGEGGSDADDSDGEGEGGEAFRRNKGVRDGDSGSQDKDEVERAVQQQLLSRLS